MRKLLFLALTATAVWFPAAAQTTVVQPNCDVAFTFTGTSQRSPITGCAQNAQGVVDWRLVYTNVGFSVVSLAVQGAPDTGGAPGSWSNFATVEDGSNPATSTAFGTNRVAGYYPWVSVLATLTGSGTIVGHLYGCKLPGCSDLNLGSGGGTGCVSPCVVIGPDAPGAIPTQSPVQVSGYDGTDVRRILTDLGGRTIAGALPNMANIALSSSGLTKIITHTANTMIVTGLLVSFTGGVTTLQLEYGTGTNCGTGTTALTGTFQSVATFAFDPPFLVPAGNDLCINLGSSLTGGGTATYAN